ncbi:MAG: SUMF1/EgtB/PvdO family nonheme iron enzyme [Bacteroidaceae bacterium]|nr:SUMF1/EgtB/PvdO family nonheme iron enzyme [Bacteroidaceae bacterium]
MKKVLFALLLLLPFSMNAQTILKGDMNDDEKVTIADVTSLVNVILGKAPQETINVGGNPFEPNNSLVVGTWYAPDGSSFTLSEDGTTNYPGSATYEFFPTQGRLLFLNASGQAVRVLPLVKVTSAYLLAVNYATEVFTYYTNSASLVTELTLSETTLAMNSGTTAQLTATASPSDAANPAVTWGSSDTSVATVDANGVVTAVAGGTCTITATATDGSGKTSSCTVNVTQMVTSITLSESRLLLGLDDYKKLTATVLPANAANQKVTWSSSNESVAEVTSTGGVAAVGQGTCTITCTAQDGSGVSTSIQVSVAQVVYGYEVFTVNDVTFTMIKVEGGMFQMGGDGESEGKPIHQVTLTNDYYIGETEVTQELWTAVMGSNPSNFTSSNKLPVEMVSWDDCQTFITKLNMLTGKTFRLPTEAEWEFAARGGNASQGYTYSGSNNLDEVAWNSGNSSSKTHEVATKAPNELGLYDMSGNVREWCQDWYGSYSSDEQTNPTGPTSGSYRVIRGGSWSSRDVNCRVANRSGGTPSDRDRSFGLRLAL